MMRPLSSYTLFLPVTWLTLASCSTPAVQPQTEAASPVAADASPHHEAKKNHDLYSIQEEWTGACQHGSAPDERQSPIALADALFAKGAKESMKFAYKKADADVVDNGHSLVVKFKGDAGKIVYEGKDYELKQFHFHKISEHTLNGKAYDMEVHFVHLGKEKAVKAIALGFLVEKGTAPAAWQKFWDKVPAHGANDPAADDEHQRTVATLSQFDARDIIPKSGSYNTYEGSLTTPPCDEYVTHMVSSKPIAFTGDDIAKFAHYHEVSNRALQPLGDAKIRKYRVVKEK